MRPRDVRSAPMAPINLREGKGRRGARRIAKRKKMRGRARRERGDGPRALYIFFSLEAAQVAACSRPMVSVGSRRKERHREGGTLLGESKAGAARPGRGAERRSPRRPETESGRGPLSPLRPRTHPNPGLGEVGPDGDLLAGGHVGVAVPLEGGLQLLQLLAGEVRPLPPLPLLLGGVLGPRILALALLALLFLCEGGRENSGAENRGTSASQASPRSPRTAPAPLIINPRPAPAGSALLCGFSAARYGSCVLPSVCAPDADGAPLSACALRVTRYRPGRSRSAARPHQRCPPVSIRSARPLLSVTAHPLSVPLVCFYPCYSPSCLHIIRVPYACYPPVCIHIIDVSYTLLFVPFARLARTIRLYTSTLLAYPYPRSSSYDRLFVSTLSPFRTHVTCPLYPCHSSSVSISFTHLRPHYSTSIRTFVSVLPALCTRTVRPSVSTLFATYSPVCIHITHPSVSI